jgi:hypothetical protein
LTGGDPNKTPGGDGGPDENPDGAGPSGSKPALNPNKKPSTRKPKFTVSTQRDALQLPVCFL